eukprot:TRINITY_DN2504_c0_g1_i1.p1 TRINITY_DN2504_c0_g1~~TRINITY_DN2504_c0_g1_i1.p1  ORF type:complete len:152 (-),score=27.44 TRINITY_DN2504_c0_g1_i1:16-471(-)
MLRDKFVNESFPLDAIFTTTGYSYLVARPLARITHVSIYEYTIDAVDAREILFNLSPEQCPMAVLFVNHGNDIEFLYRDLGYTGATIEQATFFGTLEIFNTEIPSVMGLTSFCGSPPFFCGNQDIPFPCDTPFPVPTLNPTLKYQPPKQKQ